MIGDGVDVEEHRAGNMGEPEFGRADPTGVRQVPGGVDHAEVGVAKLGGEFGGGHEIARGHGARSCRLKLARARFAPGD